MADKINKNSDPTGNLVELLASLLRDRHLTLSTAESCTGGYISHRLVLPSGASDYYMGSIIAYSNQVKVEQLDVPLSMLDAHGAVSKEVVEQMAKGVADKLKTDCSIAVSGVMGPNGGTPEKPVGTVWIATSFRGHVLATLHQLNGKREDNIHATSERALLQLINMLKVDE